MVINMSANEFMQRLLKEFPELKNNIPNNAEKIKIVCKVGKGVKIQITTSVEEK